jgi:pimeloyl-ACP methyl ester carboxylesterase
MKRLAQIVVLLLIAATVGFWLRPVSYFNGLMYAHEFLSGFQSRSVTVSGYRVHYIAAGPADGTAVVLVHGLGSRGDDWRELAPYLVKAGFRVYMPDLPGYGLSERPADFSYSVHDEADIVVGFLDALGLKQVDLGGWSMGGAIAQHVAFSHPERIRHLILFDAAGLDVAPKWDVGLFTPDSPAQLAQLDALLMPAPPEVPAFIAEDIVRRLEKNAWVVHRAIDSMLTWQDATDKLLPKLKMPVLIVWGDKDQIVPLNQGETMHQLVPQSQLDIIPGCGHLAPRQCAAQVGPDVVRFEQQQ